MSTELVVTSPRYGPETVLKLVEMATEGATLDEMALEPDTPKKGTIKRWLKENLEFRAAFFEAVQLSLAMDVPELLAIADNEDEAVPRSKLKIETRLKLHQEMSRMLSNLASNPELQTHDDPNIVRNIRDQIAEENTGLPPGAKEIKSP